MAGNPDWKQTAVEKPQATSHMFRLLPPPLQIVGIVSDRVLILRHRSVIVFGTRVCVSLGDIFLFLCHATSSSPLYNAILQPRALLVTRDNT